MTQESTPSVRPPVALGCLGAAFAVALVVFGAVFLAVFLDSGADTGKLELELAEAYAPGSVEFVGERNFYLVKLPDSTFFALVNLDAANRTAEQRQCRIAPLVGNDPRLPALLQQFGARFDPRVAGGQLVFREDCNGAVYDATGLRLSGDGRNLDRYGVELKDSGRVVVNVSERICTAREEQRTAVPVEC